MPGKPFNGISLKNLFSEKAESLAKQIAEEHKQSKGNRANKRTQIRKFYDEKFSLKIELSFCLPTISNYYKFIFKYYLIIMS